MPTIRRISDRVALADIVAFAGDDKPEMAVAAEERLIYSDEDFASYEGTACLPTRTWRPTSP